MAINPTHWSDTCATHVLSEKRFVLLKLSLKYCKNPEKSLLIEALKEALCTTTKNNKMGVLCSLLWCCPTAQLYQTQKVKCHWETPNLPTVSQHALWLEQYQSLVWTSSLGSFVLIPTVQLCSFQWIQPQEHTENCPPHTCVSQRSAVTCNCQPEEHFFVCAGWCLCPSSLRLPQLPAAPLKRLIS